MSHEPTRNVFIKGVFGLLRDRVFIGGAVILALVLIAGWNSSDVTSALHEIAEAIKATVQ